jgi:rhodanese-related sulfurtransferase
MINKKSHELDKKLAAERQKFTRLTPQETFEKCIKTSRSVEPEALLIDLRADVQRRHDGYIPSAITSIRQDNVLWRVYPHFDNAENLHPAIEPGNFDQELVFLCNQGYSSSIIAGTMAELGMTRVHDVIGGYEAWVEGGLGHVKPTPLHYAARFMIWLADKSAQVEEPKI